MYLYFFGDLAYYIIMKNRLIVYRQKLNMSQREFAELLGVTREQVNRWERQRLQPDTETLWNIWQRLRANFDINMQDLLE